MNETKLQIKTEPFTSKRQKSCLDCQVPINSQGSYCILCAMARVPMLLISSTDPQNGRRASSGLGPPQKRVIGYPAGHLQVGNSGSISAADFRQIAANPKSGLNRGHQGFTAADIEEIQSRQDTKKIEEFTVGHSKESQTARGQKTEPARGLRSAKSMKTDRLYAFMSITVKLMYSDKNGMCKCASCDRTGYVFSGGFDNGHFHDKSWAVFLALILKNAAPQCVPCNRVDYTSEEGNRKKTKFRLHLIERDGAESVDWLDQNAHKAEKGDSEPERFERFEMWASIIEDQLSKKSPEAIEDVKSTTGWAAYRSFLNLKKRINHV